MIHTADVTIANRFAAVAIRQHAERVGARFTFRALNRASYWEGFRENYAPEQVAAGAALIASCTAGATKAGEVEDFALFDDACQRVLELDGTL